MKQRILAILLSLTMMFTLVPTAMAEGETAVAKVGNDEYETLAEAVANAEIGDTIVMTADTDISKTGLSIVSSKDITLDLNGYEVKAANTGAGNIKVYGKLTLKDSTDTSANGEGHGKITTVTKTYIRNQADQPIIYAVNGDFVMQSGLIDTATGITNNSADGQFGVGVQNETADASVTINGGKIKAGWYAVAGNGTLPNHDGNITVNGGILESTTDYAIYNPQKGTTTINGGVIYGQAGGIAINCGSLVINDGMITSKGIGNTGSWGDGTGGLNNAAIHANAEYGDVSVSIKGGKVTAEGNAVTIDKGTAHTATVAISGGTFSSDISEYCEKNYYTEQNEDNTYTVKSLKDVAVAQIGDTYYKTLVEAVAAAKNDETVTLLKNAETTVELSFTNKAITLDLNGKTVSGTFTDNFSVIEAGENASLTVQDTSVAGTGKIASNKYGISARDGGALIVKRGTIESEYAPLSGNNTAGDMNFTVNGGTLTAEHGPAIYMPGQVNLSITDGVLNGGISLRMGQVSISGGTINAATDGLDSPAEYYHYSGNAWLPDALYVFGGTYTSENTTYGNSLHLNITGGTFNCANGQGSAVAIYDLGKVEQVMEITISDEAKLGTNSTARNAYDKLSLSDIGVTSPKPGFGAHSGKVSTTITGGLFSSDPSAYVPATHHVEDSGNGSYPFAVKEGAKSDATIIVTAATNAAVSDTIESGDKAKIEAVKDKANVEGMAAAIRDDKKAAIAKAAGVTDGQLAGKNMIETEITVKVEAKAADLAKGKLTFEASPVATVKVNGTATGTTVPVTNDMLNGNTITVKLPLPTGFNPEQIKHISSDGSVEYFLKTAKRGAKLFTVDSYNCAVFTITKFSTFELSGTVTYVEPSYYSGSSSDPTCSVTVDKTENGSVTVSPKSASKGSTVTITVKPDSGYVLETLTVTDSKGNELTLTDKGDGKYTFTMPFGRVEVKASFVKEIETSPFADVATDAYYYEAVKWAVGKGITTGVGDNLFAPEQPCTRAQIVTFLWRAAGSPEPKGTAAGMTDVVSGSYYEKAVAWAIENGVTTGTTATTFSPDATCTRAQSVTFLFRAIGKLVDSKAEFSDVLTDSYYANAVAWAVENGVTNGIGDGLFGPDNSCTRAQIVTFLFRAYQGK